MPLDAPTMDVLRKQAIAMAMLWLTARDYNHEGGHAWFHIRASALGLRDDVLAGKRIRVTIEAEPDDPPGVGGPQAMSNNKHGCCADKACTDATCMELPTGKTCGHCVHEKRCCAMFGHKPTDTYCDWFPRRFNERAALGVLAVQAPALKLWCSGCGKPTTWALTLELWKANHAEKCPACGGEITMAQNVASGVSRPDHQTFRAKPPTT